MIEIVIIDGKGGGIGSAIAKKLSTMKDVRLIALGTNSGATYNMLKSGASDGATGENAICHMCTKADVIVGPLGIVVANSMMGEISPKIAQSVAESSAVKLLLPSQKCGVDVMGTSEMTMSQLIDLLPQKIEQLIK